MGYRKPINFCIWKNWTIATKIWFRKTVKIKVITIPHADGPSSISGVFDIIQLFSKVYVSPAKYYTNSSIWNCQNISFFLYLLWMKKKYMKKWRNSLKNIRILVSSFISVFEQMDGSVKPFSANPTKWSNVFPSEYCKNVKNIILKNSCERLLLCSKR